MIKAFFAWLASLFTSTPKQIIAPTKLTKLKQGDTGPLVEYATVLLKRHGHWPPEPVSIFNSLMTASVEAFQRENGLTIDGVIGTKETWPALQKEPVKVEVPKPAGDYFGAEWIGVDLDLLGRDESDPELNRRYVPEWAKVGLPGYKTLMGNSHAWCAIRVSKAFRQVGVNVKGLTAAAASMSPFGRKCPFWFGAGLDIRHASGGRHVCFFLYWVDEAKRLAATLDGNKGNKFCVALTDLSGKSDRLVAGPRWPKDRPDGQLVSMAEVLAKYPNLKVGSSAGGSTR